MNTAQAILEQTEHLAQDYEIENGKLKVTSTGGPCANRIFFIPNTSKQVKSISAEVTVIEATECHRARLEILSNVVYGIRQRSGLLQYRQQILLL